MRLVALFFLHDLAPTSPPQRAVGATVNVLIWKDAALVRKSWSSLTRVRERRVKGKLDTYLVVLLDFLLLLLHSRHRGSRVYRESNRMGRRRAVGAEADQS